MRILGVILILLGGLAIAYGRDGFTYEKTEQIAKIGPLEATAKTKETIPIPPWAGGVGIGVGVILLVLGGRGGKR